MTAPNTWTWRRIVVAAIVVTAIVGVAIAGGATFYIYRHIRAEVMPVETAEARIAAARKRFAGAEAFLRIDADGDAVVTGRQDTGAPHPPVATLRALAYDPGAGRLVDIIIPFWLLRLAPNGRVSLDADSGVDFSAERLHLNVSALEALGPGLVLDHVGQAGLQVLVWTE